MPTITHILLVVFGCVAVSAAERIPQTVVITAKPRFEQREQWIYLVISNANHCFDFGWGMASGVHFRPVSLDTNRVYTFTVAQKPLDIITIPELRRIRVGGRTIYDIEICETHKTKMDFKEVGVAYGFGVPGPDAPSSDIERRLFPHRHEVSLGGCVSEPDSPKTERVYVCSQCKKAYDRWKKAHKRNI